MEKTIGNQNANIYYYQKKIEDISTLKNELKRLKEKNNKINGKYNFLETEVKELRGKVEFMEPIALSIICRKAINYSIIKF